MTPENIELLMNLNNNQGYNFVKNNFDILLKSIPKGSLYASIKKLYGYDELKAVMNERFFDTLKKAKKYEVIDIISIYLSDKTVEERVDFLRDRFVNISNYMDNYMLYKYLDYKNISREVSEKFNTRIKENKEQFIRETMIYRNKNAWVSFSDSTVFLLEKLIEELLEAEKLDWVDINYIGSGTFSQVFEIGSKVLKVGESRQTYKIPYDKRILQPLIRVDLSEISDTDYGVIEVCEKVDTSIRPTNEELYSIYKEMRDRGIVCADIKATNVGMLLRDNKRWWHNDLGAYKKPLGFKNQANDSEVLDLEDDVLKTGEFVILDSDYIYYEDDEIFWGNQLAESFEERYQLEKGNYNVKSR